MFTRESPVYTATALAVLTTMLAGLAFGWTMSRSVGWHDSPELTLAAYMLAPSHAPGSPVHGLFAYLAAGLFARPFIGTTLLSVLSAALAAGALTFIVAAISPGRIAALLAGLLFAVSYQVWASAAITEIYALNILLLSLTVLLAWRWQAHTTPAGVCGLAALYGVALGGYFANILLFPVFAWFVWRCSGKFSRVAVFSFISGIAVALIAVANYLLAMNAFPFGQVRPDSLLNIILFMTGSQHDPLNIEGGMMVLARLVEHAGIFAASVGYLPIPVALLGVRMLGKVNPNLNLLLAGVFVIYLAYYSVFGPGDYYLMVVPAYFVFCIWTGCGLVHLTGSSAKNMASFAGLVAVFIAVAGLLVSQFEGRLAMAKSRDAEVFVETTFAELPQDAIAVVGWRELTPLVYTQVVENRREDVEFILPAETARYYVHGRIESYITHIEESICVRPVFTMKRTERLLTGFDLSEPVSGQVWVRVSSRKGCS